MMGERKDKLYRPKPGEEAYPPTERGPWKRWQRALVKRRWRRKHEAGFREKEMRRAKALRERSRKSCPGCGKQIHQYSSSCMGCRSTFSGRGASTPSRVWHELNTPYRNGQNAAHERNIQRLEAELIEARV